MNLKLFYAFFIFCSCSCYAQSTSEIHSDVMKEYNLNKTDSLTIEAVKLKSSQITILYKFHYAKIDPKPKTSTSVFLIINNKIYFRNEKNSRQNGKIYQNEILPYLKYTLSEGDLKIIDKAFVLHQYPGSF